MNFPNALRAPLLVAAIAAAPAVAAGNGTIGHAEKVLEGAKVTLAQAIATAEGEVGGKALSARLMRHQHQDFYDVKLVKEGELTDVRVAIDDGKVLSTHPMAHDHATKPKPAAPEKPEQADRKG